MDKTKVSGTFDGGSIPPGATMPAEEFLRRAISANEYVAAKPQPKQALCRERPTLIIDRQAFKCNLTHLILPYFCL